MTARFTEKSSDKHPGIYIREYPNGKVSYFVKIRLKGYPAQSASFERLTDARKWKQSTESAMREGRHFKTRESKKRTIGDMIDRYIKHVMPYKTGDDRQKKSQVKLLEWWKEQIGDYALAEATPPLLIQTRDTLLSKTGREGKPISPATANRYCAILKHAFTKAVNEWQWVDENPFRKIQTLNENNERVRFLSDDERKALLTETAKDKNQVMHIVTVIALSNGARLGEILGLKWKDVDLVKGSLTFHKTKNGERRKVPLAGYALELMKEHNKVRRIDTPLVFPNRKGEKPADIHTAFYRARDAAGIEDFRFHDTRHCAASYLAMNGASLAEIAEVLGHKTMQMVKRYTHLCESHTSKVVARMNERIFRDG